MILGVTNTFCSKGVGWLGHFSGRCVKDTSVNRFKNDSVSPIWFVIILLLFAIIARKQAKQFITCTFALSIGPLRELQRLLYDTQLANSSLLKITLGFSCFYFMEFVTVCNCCPVFCQLHTWTFFNITSLPFNIKSLHVDLGLASPLSHLCK